MASNIFGQSISSPSNAAARFIHISAINLANFTNTTDASSSSPMPIATTLSKLNIMLNTAPGGAASWQFIIMKNGSSTGLSVTISGSSTTGSDAVNTVSYSAGDTISLQSVPSGTPTAPAGIFWNLQSSSADQPILVSSNGASATISYGPTGAGANSSSTESFVSMVMPTAGTFSNLYVRVRATPTVAMVSTLVKNGIASLLTCTVTNPGTTASDTSDTVSVSAGDRISISVTGNSTGNSPLWGVSFTPTNAGESVVGFGFDTTPSTSAVNYQSVIGARTSWETTEGNAFLMPGAGTMKAWYARTNTASGVAKSYDFTVRKNSGNTALTVNCANTTTAQSITTDVSLSANDTIDFAVTPNGTPTASRMNTGLLFVATAATPPAASVGNTLLMMGI